jgi:three-Cys-motif partner protein
MDTDMLPARCVGIWSDDKLFYLKRYADIFAKGMKNKWPNRVYLDPFAGPGRCRVRPTGEFVDGSPALALKLPFTHYHFGDLSPNVTAALDTRVKKTALDGRSVRVWTDDANKVAPLFREEVLRLGRETVVRRAVPRSPASFCSI